MYNLIPLILVLTLFSNCDRNQIEEYNSTQTDKHITVPGTRISLIPPEGFELTNNVPQLEDFKGSGIMITEAPKSFYEASLMHTQEVYETVKESNLIEKTEIIFNGYDAVFMITDRDAYGSKVLQYSLMFGNNNMTVVIIATLPIESEDKMAKKMRNSIFTTTIDLDKIADPLATLGFEIEVSKTELKIAWVSSSMIVYTRDGNDPPNTEDETTLGVIKAWKEKGTYDPKELTIKIMKQFAPTDLEIMSIDAITINNLRGYEVVGYEKKMQQKTRLIFITTLFTKEHYFYSITADSNMEFIKNLSSFRKIAQTFKIKNHTATNEGL